jgi:phosphohistidine phosphatase
VYLVRHGEAQAEEVDPERHLTADGAETVRRIAVGAFDRLYVRPSRIFHSGKSRARQTAEIWAELTHADLTQADGLGPNDDPAAWATRLQGEDGDVMVVGHLPHLHRLAALLVTGDAEPAVAEFPPGGVVALERTERGWSVINP